MDKRVLTGIDQARHWLSSGMGENGIRKSLLRKGYEKDEVRVIISEVFKRERIVEGERHLARNIIVALALLALALAFYHFLWGRVYMLIVESAEGRPDPSWSWLTVDQASMSLGEYTVYFAENAPLRDFRGRVCDYRTYSSMPKVIRAAIVVADNQNECGGCEIPELLSGTYECGKNSRIIYVVPADREADAQLSALERGKNAVITAKEVQGIGWGDGAFVPEGKVLVMAYRIQQYR